MSEEQDGLLRKALRGVQAPPPGEDARERVCAAVAAAAAEGAAERTAAPAAAERPISRRWRPLAVIVRRRRLAIGLAAVAAASLVAGVLLAGPPGGGGPEPVRAQQVLQRAMRALSSGRTLAATVTIRAVDTHTLTGQSHYDVERYGFVLRADGSYRLSRHGRSRFGWSPTGGSHPAADVVYDARRGVLRTYSRTWGLIERYGYPPGPPDRWAGTVTAGDPGATARALEVVGAARLKGSSYQGRPVWIVTCSLASGPSRPAITAEWPIFEITIDGATSFPIRFRMLQDGVLQMEVLFSDIRINAPLPDRVFELKAPSGTKVTRIQDGFRRATIAQIAQLPGYAVLEPAILPRGYTLSQAAAAPRSVTANRLVEGRKVVALHYARGFDTLTLTTRTVTDPSFAAQYDPFEFSSSWAGVVAWPATIRAGAFRGVTAQVVVAPATTTPHLWAVKDGVLLTVAGSATAEELLAVAASLESASR
jgi:hypothetical protein